MVALDIIVNEDLDDCADAFGNLSIDENREVRPLVALPRAYFHEAPLK